MYNVASCSTFFSYFSNGYSCGIALKPRPAYDTPPTAILIITGNAKTPAFFLASKVVEMWYHSVTARKPGLQVYLEIEGDRRHREEASTLTPRWLPTDLGNGITLGYQYEVEPSKVQPIQHVDIQLGLF